MLGGLNTAMLASTGVFVEDVASWKSNIESDGGEVSQKTLEALNEFIITLRVNNIRNKIKRCNLFCGSNLRASLHPIIVGDSDRSIGYLKDKNFGFAEYDYSETGGLSAAGATALGGAGSKYLETDVFLSSVDMSSSYGHLSFMSTSADVSLSSVGGYMMPLCGGDYSIENDLSSYIEFNSDQILKAGSPSSFAPGSSNGYVRKENVNSVGGFWLANRTSNINQKLYKDAVEYDDSDATSNQSAYPIGGYKFRIFGAYSGGQVTQTSIYKLLFYSMGAELTETEITVLNGALTKFNSSLGRI
jgi:hypothetical protein